MIYLDNFATTPVDPRVLEYYHKTLKDEYGNPSSLDHELGTSSAKLVKSSRQKIADLLNCDPAEITFTSGATESISLFLQGFVDRRLAVLGRKLKIVSSPVEHPAVLENLQALSANGHIELSFLTVDVQGRVDLTEIEQYCKQGIDLLCVMAVNNEIGNIYPFAKIAALVSEGQGLFFCDATQAIGKIDFTLENLPNTVVAFSGHKFYAPKGIGVLIADTSIAIKPLFFGGGQQRGLRPDTINAPLIGTLARALEYAVGEQQTDSTRILLLRDQLEANMKASFPQLVVNGDLENRVPGISHVSLPGINNKQLITKFRTELAVSTGAACSSGSERPSHVLKAMQLPKDQIEGAFRISLGRFTTEREISEAVKVLQS